MTAPGQPADRSDAADRGPTVSDHGEHGPGEPRPVTFGQAADRYGLSASAARERYHELNMRDHLARVYAGMRAFGAYEPQKHGAGHPVPLSTAEHLELLATAEYLSRAIKPSCHLDYALNAGATWEQAADALGASHAAAQAAHRERTDRPPDFLRWIEGRAGPSDSEQDAAARRLTAAATRRAADPGQRGVGS